MNHGEAVLLGINSALKFSDKINLIDKKQYKIIKSFQENSYLPWDLNNYFLKKNINKILSFMIKDKKNNSDKISLVLLKKIGQPLIDQEYNKKRLKLFLKNQLVN